MVAGYDRLDPSDAAYFSAQRRRLETVGLASYDALRSQIRSRYASVPVGYSESIFQGLGENLGLKLVTPPSFAKSVAEGTDVTAADYRRGGVRSAIAELLDEQPCALSAVEIGEALAGRGRGVSRASVYRVMEELERIGLLARVEVGQGIVRYEPVRGGSGHHHHLVCERCGRLQPFAERRLDRSIPRGS